MVCAMIERLGIIGDVHAEDDLLERALRFLDGQAMDVLLCTGDIVDGTGDVRRCVDLLTAYGVKTVAGNHDRWCLQDRVRHIPNAHLRETLDNTSLAYLEALPRQVTVQTAAGKLLLCHGIGENDLQKVWPGSQRLAPERSTLLDEMISTGDIRWLVNGHMHYRTLIEFQALTLLNAGTLKNRHRPGFAVLDIGQGHVLGYEFNPDPVAVKRLQFSAAPRFVNTQDFDGLEEPSTLYAS